MQSYLYNHHMMFLELCRFVLGSKPLHKRVTFKDWIKKKTRANLHCVLYWKKPPMGYILALWTHFHLPLDATHLLNMQEPVDIRHGQKHSLWTRDTHTTLICMQDTEGKCHFCLNRLSEIVSCNWTINHCNLFCVDMKTKKWFSLCFLQETSGPCMLFNEQDALFFFFISIMLKIAPLWNSVINRAALSRHYQGDAADVIQMCWTHPDFKKVMNSKY